jgi:hypothetical protein
MKRNKFLDRSIPTLFSFSIPFAIFSLWSDVWEFYLSFLIALLLLNIWYFRDVLRRALSFDVYQQIRSALPINHTKSKFYPPGNGEEDGFDDIRTGSQQGENLMSIKSKVLGITMWLLWFSIGIYFWWFTDTRPIEYFIATVLWILTFIFTALGIPFLQAILRDRTKL